MKIVEGNLYVSQGIFQHFTTHNRALKKSKQANFPQSLSSTKKKEKAGRRRNEIICIFYKLAL